MSRSYPPGDYPGGPPYDSLGRRALRGPKRANLGRIIPGDHVENTRDHERLWLWLNQVRRKANANDGSDSFGTYGCFASKVIDQQSADLLRYYDFQETSGLLGDRSDNDIGASAVNGSLSYQQTGAFKAEPSLKSIEFTPAPQSSGTITVGDYFTIPTTDITFSANADFCIETVFRIDTLPVSRMGILGCHDGTNGWKLGVTSTGAVEFVRGATTVTTGVLLSADRDYHVAVNYDGTNIRILINGVVVKVAASAAALTAGTVAYIGVEPGATNYFFDGWMSAVVIWSAPQAIASLAQRAGCVGVGGAGGGLPGTDPDEAPPDQSWYAWGGGHTGNPGVSVSTTGLTIDFPGADALIPMYKYWANRGWKLWARGVFNNIAGVGTTRVDGVGAWTQDTAGVYQNGAYIKNFLTGSVSSSYDYTSGWSDVSGAVVDVDWDELDTVPWGGYMENDSGFFDTNIGSVIIEFRWFGPNESPDGFDEGVTPGGPASDYDLLQYDSDKDAWMPRIPYKKSAAKTANYTAVVEDDEVLFCDATAGAFTITLPDAADLNGATFYIKKVDSSANAVTIDPAGGDTVDGGTTYLLSVQNESVMVVSDGTNYKVLADKRGPVDLHNVFATTVTKTADYTATGTDDAILVDCNGANRTITLPAAASHSGRVYVVKKIDSGDFNVTIDGNGAETIDGATTMILYGEDESVIIVCDGSNWHVIQHDVPKWRPYTPTWTASVTNPTIGNGTITGRYRKVGKTVEVRIRIDIGGTTTVGSGVYQVSLPFTARSGHYQPGGGLVYDSSANQTFFMFLRADGYVMDAASSPAAFWTDAVPFIPATSDFFELNVTFEEA